jgi:hypothetical protein
MAKPNIPDIETLIQAGINPKTGLPLKFGNKRCTTKEDIKKLIRKNDEQIFVNKYVWYNLPMNLSSAELERMLYYKGQLAFFYLKDLDEMGNKFLNNSSVIEVKYPGDNKIVLKLTTRLEEDACTAVLTVNLRE